MTTNADPNTILQDLINRLQNHLSSSSTSPGTVSSTSSSSSTSTVTIPKWLTAISIDNNTTTNSISTSPLLALGSLFQAYDNRINELTTSNHTLLDTVSKSKTIIENLINENTKLSSDYTILQDKYNQLLITSSNSSSSTSSSSSSSTSTILPAHTYSTLDADKALLSTEITSIREEIKYIRRNNLELTQQLNDKEIYITTLTGQQRTLTTTLTQTQAALRHVDTEKRKYETENKKFLRLLDELQGQRDTYYEQINTLQKDLYEANNQINQYRNALNELGTAASTEAETLSNQMKQSTERANHYKLEVEQLTNELDTAKNELIILRQDILFLRSDGERMLKALRDLETKVSGVEEREEIARTSKITADTIKANAEHEIMIAKQNEETAKQELIKVLQRRKEEIVLAQQHEMEAVNQVRNRLTEIITSRDNEISTLRQEIILTKESMDRTAREIRTVTEEKKQLKELFIKEQEKLNQVIPELTQRVTLAEENKLIADNTARETTLKMTTALANIEITKNDLQLQITVAQDTINRLSVQIAEYESKCRSLTLQLTETERLLHAAKRENQDMRNRMSETTTALNLQASGYGLKSSGINLLGSLSTNNEQYHDKLAQETAYIDEITLLKSRIQELTSLLQAIQKDYTAAITAAKEADESLAQVRTAYIASEGIIVELTSQLHSATQREDSRLKEVQEAKTTAELAKLTNIRLQTKLDTLTHRLEQTEKENMEAKAQLRTFNMS